jgi:protein-disulfide isomerase
MTSPNLSIPQGNSAASAAPNPAARPPESSGLFSLLPQNLQAQAGQRITADQQTRLADETGNLVFGNPEGSQVVYAVVDYNCGHCRSELTDLLTLTDRDDDVKVVLKNFPILGNSSEDAALGAAAIAEGPPLTPEQTRQFIQNIAGSEVRLDQTGMMELYGQAAGSVRQGQLDKQYPEAIRSEKFSPSIESNYNLAHELGINGTPAIIYNSEILEDRSSLPARIEQSRQSQIQKNLELDIPS